MNPTSAAFFEARYGQDADPWRFASSPYELGRYRALLTAIGDGPFRSAFEPGCSIGVFTELLAPRCARLTATDVSPTAVAAAARRNASHPHVQIGLGALPAVPSAPSDGPFDLIVFSELGYYFERPELAELVEQLVDHLQPDAMLAGTHWTGRSVDHRLHADDVHATLAASHRLGTERDERHDGFRLGVWRRR